MKTLGNILLGLLCFMAEQAFGTTRRVPSQYATIQAAINASVHGDTVLVSDGTYYENIRFKGKKIVVASTYATTGDTSHISHTIIDGSASTDPDSGSVVYFISGEDTNSVLCGFTVRGGRGTYLPLFTDMEGGGVLCWESGAKLIRNIITGNTLTGRPHCYGGGISANNSTNQNLIVEYNIIRGNNCTSTTGQAIGAGMSTYHVDAVIKYNDITDNIASTLAYNVSGIGGGLDLEFGSSLVEGNLIARNKALSPNCNQDGGGAGGGVWVKVGNTNLLNNRIVENVVQSVFRAWGGGICMWADAVADLRDIVVKGNYIASNTVSGGSGASLSSGGGIYSRDERPRIENNIIVKNIAPYGGAFSAQRSSTESASADNSVTGGVAMGRRARVQTVEETAVRPVLILDAPVLINNTIAYNRATANQGAAIATVGSWTPKVINTIAWGDTGSSEIYVYSGSISVLYSDIQGTTIYPGQGNINVNPQFADTLLHLANTSGCLQRGIDSVQVDGTWHHAPPFCIYGMARPTPAGTLPDIGACENPIRVGVDESQSGLPTSFALSQNYPNPFNPTTAINYQLPTQRHVTLVVYDMLGREVATLVNEFKHPGAYTVQWDGSGLASGVYFYRLSAGSFVQLKKMLLLK